MQFRPLSRRSAMLRQAGFAAVGGGMVAVGVVSRSSPWTVVGAADVVIFSAALIGYATLVKDSPVGAETAVALDSSANASSLVFRRSTEGDKARKYVIEIDGQKAGVLRPGDSLSVSLRPGVHTYRAKLDVTGSPEYSVHLAPDERVCLTVRRSPDPSFIGRTGWIVIDRA